LLFASAAFARASPDLDVAIVPQLPSFQHFRHNAEMGVMRDFGRELFRRKVVRVVGAYIAILWLLLQGFASLFPVLGIADWILRALIVIGIGAIPIVAFFSWKYDIVAPQIVRDIKDVEAKNPGLSWARLRHDTKNAGYLLLTWGGNPPPVVEKRFFQPVAIGREANNDIELTDDRVSRHHAVLWAEDGEWHVRDLESANGTYIGHTRVVGSVKLPGSCDLRFHANGPVVRVHVAKSAETRIG
jgi:FHA domain